MGFNIIITEHAEELINRQVDYLLHGLKNVQSVQHLLEEIDKIYDRLSQNPFQFPVSKDRYLASKGYHEAILPRMNYMFIFAISETTVTILGMFHQLENYASKI